MIDPRTRTLRLIDWGLAEFYHAGVEYNVRVASRYYKGPELLVNLYEYDYSLDLWSLGCVLAGMIFKIDVLFHGSDNDDQLIKILDILGMKDFERYLVKYNLKMPKQLKELLADLPTDRSDWISFINEENQHLANAEAIDLLNGLLRYDHAERLSAAEAMSHPYFNPVRNVIMSEASAMDCSQ